MTNKVTVELYYATWCGHCKNFKGEWEKLKQELAKKGYSFGEYEDEQDRQKIEEENIQGYPTILISKNGKKEEYNGPRTSNDIMDFVSGKSGNADNSNSKFKQCGGASNRKTPRKSNEYWKLKYLKYKAKYMKSKME